MALGNAYTQRSTIPGATEVGGVWTGGGAAADMTNDETTAWNRGIVSVAYNAATGKYLMTFTDVGQQVIGFSACVASATGDGPLFITPVKGSLSTSAKTLAVECNDGSGTLTDLPATAEVQFNVKFAQQKP